MQKKVARAGGVTAVCTSINCNADNRHWRAGHEQLIVDSLTKVLSNGLSGSGLTMSYASRSPSLSRSMVGAWPSGTFQTRSLVERRCIDRCGTTVLSKVVRWGVHHGWDGVTILSPATR